MCSGYTLRGLFSPVLEHGVTPALLVAAAPSRRPQTIALLYAVATAWGRIGVAAPEIPLKSLSIRIPDYQRAWLDARRRPHQPISALFRDLLDTAMLQDDGASIPTTPAGRDQ